MADLPAAPARKTKYGTHEEWYALHPKPTKVSDWRTGLGFTDDEFVKLRQEIAQHVPSLKTGHTDYRTSSGGEAKQEHCQRLLELVPNITKHGGAPTEWLMVAVQGMISRAQGNQTRREARFSASKSLPTARAKGKQVGEDDLVIVVQVEDGIPKQAEVVVVKSIRQGDQGEASLEELRKRLSIAHLLPNAEDAVLMADYDDYRAPVRDDAFLNLLLKQATVQGKHKLEMWIRTGGRVLPSIEWGQQPLALRPSRALSSEPVHRPSATDTPLSHRSKRLQRKRLRQPSSSSNDAGSGERTRRPNKRQCSRARNSSSEKASPGGKELEGGSPVSPEEESTTPEEDPGESEASGQEEEASNESGEEELDQSRDSEYETSKASEIQESPPVQCQEATPGQASNSPPPSSSKDESEVVGEEEEEEEEVDEEAQKELNMADFAAQLYRQGMQDLDERLARVDGRMLELVPQYLPRLDMQQFLKSADMETPGWGLAPGFRLNPYQIAFAVWAFHQEMTVVGGGILADATGAGKTIQLYALWMMRYFHYQNVMEVEEAQARGDPTHLPVGHAPGHACPSADQQPIACYCAHRSLYPTEPRRGITLTLTVNAGLRSFQKDAETMFRGGEVMKRLHPPRIAIHVDKYNKDEFTGALTQEEVSAVCKVADWSAADAHNANERSFLVNGILRTAAWSTPVFTGACSSSPDATSTMAPRHASSVMIITTRGSLKTQVESRFIAYRRSRWQYSRQSAAHCHNPYQSLLQLSSLYWDECHQDAGGRVIPDLIKAMVQEYQSAYGRNPVLWGASGTPDNGNCFTPLKLLTTALSTPAWADVEQEGDLGILRELTSDQLDQYVRDFDRLNERAKTSPSMAMQDPSFSKLVEVIRKAVPLFQIRRTDSTTWYDQQPVIPKGCALNIELVYCKPNQEEEHAVLKWESMVATEQTRKYQELVDKWVADGKNPKTEPEVPKKGSMDTYCTALAAASMAQVVEKWARMVERSGGDATTVRCSKSHSIINQWVQEKPGYGYWKVLGSTNILKNAKVVETLKICNHVRRDRLPDGSPCKIIVATRKPLLLRTWQEILVHAYGNEAVIPYTAGMTNTNRTKAADRFDNHDKAWILLCSFGALGTSMNLQRGNRVIMLEPSHKYAQWRQLFGRVHRRGQKASQCYGYVFINHASGIEKRMVKSAEFTQAWQDLVYKQPDAAQKAVEVDEEVDDSVEVD